MAFDLEGAPEPVPAPAAPQADDASAKQESTADFSGESSSLGAGAPAVTEDSYETNNQVSSELPTPA